ncbi:MAG: hypothetical protein O3B74_07255 [Proteobacteria bacterium]|nr:hypothetical protein [Pseudomonadota bacterium]MDA1308027.1 hypothetical protein [Pseudomonadota bacterium]
MSQELDFFTMRKAGAGETLSKTGECGQDSRETVHAIIAEANFGQEMT